MNQGIIAVNGRTFSPQEATIPALDRGFLYGDSIFETFVAFGSQILDCQAHLNRLRFSGQEIALEIPWSSEELTSELLMLCAQVPAPKKLIRLIVTRGLGFGLNLPEKPEFNRVVCVFPAPPEAANVYTQGLKLRLRRSSNTERQASAKTSNYLPSILAINHARQEGFDEVLWSNSAGEITEAATSNVFFMGRQGDLVEVATPHTNSGILEGITRARLMELLNSAKIPVTERVIYADEIPRFDEAFLCSTVRGLVPIVQIDQHRLHSARDSSIFRHFERLYFTSVERDLGYRVDWNTGLSVAAASHKKDLN